MADFAWWHLKWWFNRLLRGECLVSNLDLSLGSCKLSHPNLGGCVSNFTGYNKIVLPIANRKNLPPLDTLHENFLILASLANVSPPKWQKIGVSTTHPLAMISPKEFFVVFFHVTPEWITQTNYPKVADSIRSVPQPPVRCMAFRWLRESQSLQASGVAENPIGIDQFYVNFSWMYHLVMTNSLPWYRWPIEIDSVYLLKMVIVHGYK